MKQAGKASGLIACALAGMTLLGACAAAAGQSGREEAQSAQYAPAATLALAECSAEDFDTEAEGALTVALDNADYTSDGAAMEEGDLVIRSAGTYLLSGELTGGAVRVETSGEEPVHLVLDGASVTSEEGPALYAASAAKVVITLAEGSENTLADGAEYLFDEGEDEPDAAIFSKCDLTVNGTGSLAVTSASQTGIKCKDALRIISGTITVKAAKNGMVGRDLLVVKGGTIAVDAGEDGLKSTNDTDLTQGFIVLENGSIAIDAGEDGIQAAASLLAAGGSYQITAGGGAGEIRQAAAQPEGEKTDGRPEGPRDMSGTAAAEGELPGGRGGRQMDGDIPADRKGTPPDFREQAPDMPVSGSDAGKENAGEDEESAEPSCKGIKAGSVLTIAGGVFEIDSADDALHANHQAEISGGEMTVRTGGDGLHADDMILFSGGVLNIRQSDEGVEAAVVEISGGTLSVTASDDGLNAASDTGGEPQIRITGGVVYIDAQGDGIDSNGSVEMSGGDVTVDGPTGGGDSALDYDRTFIISGGTLRASGSAAMAQNVSDGSAQSAVQMSFSAAQPAGTEIEVCDESGTVVLSATPKKAFSSIILSDPALQQGETYTLSVNGSELIRFELANAVTNLNESGVVETPQNGSAGGRGDMGGRAGKDMAARSVPNA